MRHDKALQTSVEEDKSFSSRVPPCVALKIVRIGQVAIEYHRVIVDQFIDSYSATPKELILDFDATDSTIYGEQEGRTLHGYYGDYCFLSLYVYCGNNSWSTTFVDQTKTK